MTDRIGCQPFTDELLEEKGLLQHFQIIKFKTTFNWTVLTFENIFQLFLKHKGSVVLLQTEL